MLVIINDCLKQKSDKARAIIGRYCWRIAMDVWVWPKNGIRENILKELQKVNADFRVVFIWSDSTHHLGFRSYVFGDLKSRQTDEGIFNHLVTISDN